MFPATVSWAHDVVVLVSTLYGAVAATRVLGLPLGTDTSIETSTVAERVALLVAALVVAIVAYCVFRRARHIEALECHATRCVRASQPQRNASIHLGAIVVSAIASTLVVALSLGGVVSSTHAATVVVALHALLMFAWYGLAKLAYAPQARTSYDNDGGGGFATAADNPPTEW